MITKTINDIKLTVLNFINSNRRLKLASASSSQDYRQYHLDNQKNYRNSFNFENSIIPKDNVDFTLNGFCQVCKETVPFIVDFLYSYEVNGRLTPNWRERLVCPKCNLNNRLRAAIHLFNGTLKPDLYSKIYITEQTTSLYNHLKSNFSDVIGSEYLGDSVQRGHVNEAGIRNEDLTQLTFQENELDFILTFDVLEHIPNYQTALAECYRSLKPNGSILISVPFILMNEENLVRARINNDGVVEHLLPPEYHGDPINSDGLLCYYHFGWQLLEDMKSLGFKDTKMLLYWSKHFGYLGGEQSMLFARKT